MAVASEIFMRTKEKGDREREGKEADVGCLRKKEDKSL